MPLENRVDPAAQAAARLSLRRCFVIADFNFGVVRALLNRKHGNQLVRDGHEVGWHLVALQNFNFDRRLGMLVSGEILVDAGGGALAVADSIDKEPWTKNAIATRENTRGGGHEVFRVHDDQPARCNFHAVLRPQEIKLRALADCDDHRVTRKLTFTILMEGRIEASLGVEDPLGSQSREAHNLVITSQNLLRAEASMQNDS